MSATQDYITCLEEYIRKVVDAAPTLSPEQRDLIAALLRPSIGASE